MNSLQSGFSVYDFLLLVGSQGRIGELILESGNNIGSIVVHEGKVLQAFSPYSRALGDLLVDEGVITEAELLDALTAQKKDMAIPLGTMLMKTGKVTFALIEKLVHAQIRMALGDFARWENINYSFLAKDIRPFDRIHLTVLELLPAELLDTMKTFIDKRIASNATVGQSTPHPGTFPGRS